MPQNDIDKILEELKARKERTKGTQTATPKAEQPQAETAAVEPARDVQISEKDKATLSRFINKSSEPEPEDHIQLVTVPDQNQYTSKKSEDYKIKYEKISFIPCFFSKKGYNSICGIMYF